MNPCLMPPSELKGKRQPWQKAMPSIGYVSRAISTTIHLDSCLFGANKRSVMNYGLCGGGQGLAIIHIGIHVAAFAVSF